MDYNWGIDLGGTKIEGVVLHDEDITAPRCRLRVPTEAEQGYEHILSQIRSLVERMKSESGAVPRKIGFGTPGVMDPKLGVLKNSNTQCLNGKPLAQDLERVLGCSVTLTNDANCFALAEALLGAAKGAENVFGVIMGTGVGGGVVVEKKMIRGLQGIAGEWGHNVLDPQGAPCYCGKRGCVEKVFSGPALEDFFEKCAGTRLRLHEIVALHKAGKSEHATATIRHLCDSFGRAISVVINILDPEVVVLGGGVSNVDELYTWGVEAASRAVFNNRLETKIVRHQLGDSAGVFGAALLT